MVVTDLILPGSSGTELIEAIHSADPDVEVVAISGDPDWLAVVEKKFAGRAGVRAVAKPFTTPQLLEALDAVRGPRPAVQESMAARILARLRTRFRRVR